MKRALLNAALASTLIAAAIAGCGSEEALVGGECAPGLVECNLKCVDLATDPENCGACGNACDPGVVCVAGKCGGVHPTNLDGAPQGDGSDIDANGTVDGSGTDGASDGTTNESGANDGTTGDGSNDGTTGDGSNGDGSNGDGSNGDGSNGDGGPDACATPPPYDTHDHCGSCFIACGQTDVCKPSGDGTYACATSCDPPTAPCNGRCMDFSSDPDNCGACGKTCPSHLCAAGVCQGSTPGDVIVIGHDYATTPLGTAQDRLLTNAVFLPGTNPLRVMTYERYSDPVAVASAKAILAGRATQLGRGIAYTIATADDTVRNGLAATSYDVLIVFDQVSAPAGALGALGTSWASVTNTFAKGGGVIVTLDGATGTGEMPALVASAGLLSVSAHAALAAGSAVTVIAPNDAVGFGVLSPYGVWNHTAHFTVAADPNVTPIVRANDGSNEPLVLHRVVP